MVRRRPYDVRGGVAWNGVGVLTGGRGAPLLGMAGAAVVLLVAGCTAAEDPVPLPSAAPSFGALDCTVTVDATGPAEEALAAAEPGSTVCITGDDLRDADFVLSRSGEPGRPIVVAADGAQVRSVSVQADFAVVQGFAVVDGEGITLSGRGLGAVDNHVARAAIDGISCEQDCADVLIEGNTVVGADGSGIIVEGDRITVRGNTVSGSTATGWSPRIRFFGTDVQILQNTVTDIKDDGYGDDPPHTDCFQTYDNSRIPTVDAVISDNVCRNVDHQCLIATAEEAGNSGETGRSRGIEFTGNECDVNGSQAVLVQWFPGVVVRGNTFEGTAHDRAAIFLDGSTDGEFTGNTVASSVPPHQVDDSSEHGFTTDHRD